MFLCCFGNKKKKSKKKKNLPESKGELFQAAETQKQISDIVFTSSSQIFRLHSPTLGYSYASLEDFHFYQDIYLHSREDINLNYKQKHKPFNHLHSNIILIGQYPNMLENIKTAKTTNRWKWIIF